MAAKKAPTTPASRRHHLEHLALEEQQIVSAFPAQDAVGSAFASLGGSNSLGACDTTGKTRCNQTGFAALTYTALHSLGVVQSWANGAIGAMGPQLASACTNKFAPAGSRFATIEYLPNLGYTNDDAGELAALEKLLHVLQRRGARVVFVNILPGSAMPRFQNCREGKIGCTTRQHIESLHSMISGLAANYSVPMVTMDHDGASGEGRFGSDLMHLNQAGHEHVRDRLMHLYATWAHWQRGLDYSAHDDEASRAASRLPVACHLGEELEALVGAARGFSRTNFARDPATRADKVGWEAREAGASLTLCANFPPQPAALLEGVRERPLLSNGGKREYQYVLAVGMQLSHALNLPLFGVAHFQCHGGCACMCRWSHHGAFNESCYYDGLAHGGATVTAFVRMLASKVAPPLHDGTRECRRDACAVTITNSPDPGEVRRRVLVRALMMGFNEHSSSKWLNTYHLDGTGLTTYRRRRRERAR